MKKQANSVVTPETGNAINNGNQFSDSRLTAAAIFAFLPPFGIIGVHNFILKQYKKGIAHIAVVIACYLLYIIDIMLCDYGSDCFGMFFMLAMFLRYVVVALYIWAIVEGIQILRLKKQKTLSLPTTSNPNTIQSSKPTMDAGNTSYFVADQPSPETVAEIEQRGKQDRKVWPILSIVATMIPIILWVFCFIVSGGSVSEGGSGVVWWLMVMYYWTLGIPLAVISIAFGIVGLKSSLRRLSIISLRLKATTIIAIVLLLLLG